MSKQARNLWAGGLAAGCLAVAMILVPAWLRGYDLRSFASSASPADRLVVHEWGTFTSFAGSNGVNLDYRPLVTNDLPRFVMGPWSQPGSQFATLIKERFVAQQRMETPVTYFYTDVPQMVNVRVEFPQGMLTDWYPVVKAYESGQRHPEHGVYGSSYLDWGAVRLTPAEQFADVLVRGPKGEPVPASLPPVSADDHYGHARETDSAIVETVDANGGNHFEKFLFYRGLGNFELPLKLVALGGDRFEVTNSSMLASGAMLLVRIDAGRVRFARAEPIAPQSAVEIELPSRESTVEQLAQSMVAELNAAGLYDKESLSMVNTWRTSWFGEDGTRLLYLVPGQLTEELLPLKVEPAPDESVRVLVGRLETLTPEDCRRLAESLAGGPTDDAARAEVIKTELASLGRFAEPAVQYLIEQTGDPAQRGQLEAILAQVREGR